MHGKMRAAIFQGPQLPLKLEDRDIPQLQSDDDVLIKVGGVGICGSDLAVLQSAEKHPALPGIIFGHEFCGEIVEIGADVKSVKIGDHVAVNQNPGCGKCYMCREGYPNACERMFDNPKAPSNDWPNTPGQWWDGGMANYVRVPSYFCYPIDKSVPLHHVAAFEPLGVVLNAISKVKPQPGETSVVFGGGAIGLFAAAILKLSGAAHIIGVEMVEERKKLLKDCGADHVLDPRVDDVNKIVRELTGGHGAHVAVECVGMCLPQAVDVLRHGGRLAQIGLPSREITWKPLKLCSKEIEIYGSYLMKNSANKAVELLENRQLPIDKIVTHVFPLEEANKAIETARAGIGGKIVIQPNP